MATYQLIIIALVLWVLVAGPLIVIDLNNYEPYWERLKKGAAVSVYIWLFIAGFVGLVLVFAELAFRLGQPGI